NTKVYVLDRYMRALPVGVPGELYVSGTGVARGYRKQPEMTAERFLLFHARERVYRTGDLVRFRDDGNLQFLGRVDEQVKIRGYRIETGELEVGLNRHPAIKQCAVMGKRELSVDTSFFELGGHSLMATRVVSRLEAVFGVEIPLTEFFGSPTISGLARWIEANRTLDGAARTAAIPRRDSGAAPVL